MSELPLQIFISSTQTDLQPERNAAEEVVANLGHHCLRAESYASPGTSSHDACKAMALNCDIYIGVYGKRYGFVPLELGMSVTEMEYRVAKGSNPAKVFVYIKDEEVSDEDQLRFLEEVQDFSSGYFRHGKFRTESELADQIRQDLNVWIVRRVREALHLQQRIRDLEDEVAFLRGMLARRGLI